MTMCKEGLQFSGPARFYDGGEDRLKTVVVIRYESPKGGPIALIKNADTITC